MSKKLAPGKILLISTILLTLVATGVWGWIFANKLKTNKSLPVLSTVQDFSLVERSGRPVTRTDLRENIWVVDFIFTSCAGPCPLMSRRMSQLQTAFAHAGDVKLLSVSVDPERDTPQVLSQYAANFGADPEKWLFLTGEKRQILNLARNSLKVAVKEATADSPIVHSTYFILLDKLGRIRGYYNSAEPNSLSQLAMDVERLRMETTHSEG